YGGEGADVERARGRLPRARLTRAVARGAPWRCRLAQTSADCRVEETGPSAKHKRQGNVARGDLRLLRRGRPQALGAGVVEAARIIPPVAELRRRRWRRRGLASPRRDERSEDRLRAVRRRALP